MSGSKLSNPVENNSLVDAPLGMTVHSMPAPAEVADAEAHRTRRGRVFMLMVLLLCAAPVIASYFTYYVVRPEGGRNFGELIQPALPMPTVQAVQLDGQIVPLQKLRGQWLLVTVAPAGCDKVCENNLYFQRQLRETQGKEKDRIDRVWLVTDDAPVSPALSAGLQGAQVLRVSLDALSAWLKPAAGQALADHLYVVDPMGNWMMRFPAGMDVQMASKARRDLERLMRASASWDEAGR
ncbi:MAG: hypothetical protein RLZ63_1754 [Pseudomonadota bacterium]|jgi:hypothetical protein